MCPKWGFWGFEGEDVKILSYNPQKALPGTLREYASVDVLRDKIGSTA